MLATQPFAQADRPLEDALTPPYREQPASLPPASAVGSLVLAIAAFLVFLYLLFKRRPREVASTLLITLMISLGLTVLAVVRWPSLPTARSPETPPPGSAREEEEAITEEETAVEEETAAADPEADLETEASPDPSETRQGNDAERETGDAPAEPSEAIAAEPGRAPTSPPPTDSPAPRAPSSALAAGSAGSVPRPGPAAPPAPVGERPARARRSDYRQIPDHVTLRTLLRRGDRGYDVALLQTLLARLGYYDRAVDGDFGLRTEVAVREFQRDRNLAIDGIVGFSTCNILRTLALELDPSPLNRTTMQCTAD